MSSCDRRDQRWGCRLTGMALLYAVVVLPNTGFAQLTEQQLSHRSGGPGWLGRFKGSQAQLATYLGSGTFVTDGYSRNPYFAQELLLLPRFKLATHQSARLFWALECEYTAPDDPAGRHCSPSDMRLSYHHTTIWRDPWIGGRVMGSAQLWLPTSYASWNNHTIVNLRGTVAYLVYFFDNRLELSYAFGVQKYVPSSKVRGLRDSESDGEGLSFCFMPSSASVSAGCGSGGPMNDNWLFRNSLHVAFFFRPNLWLLVDFGLHNYIRFAVPDDETVDPDLATTGRRDQTVGNIELAYQPQDHVVLAIGTLSVQPALTADGKSLRFPFWDFVSPSNNFSKVYFTAAVVY